MSINKGYVYIYYYGNDKKLAEYENRDTWECKIGKTNSSVEERIEQQVTGIPRNPVIAHVFEVTRPYHLETMLHDELWDCKIHEKHAGNEWFMTNPQKVIDLFEGKFKDLKSFNLFEYVVDVPEEDKEKAPSPKEGLLARLQRLQEEKDLKKRT